MKARLTAYAPFACLLLAAVVEVTLWRRHRAMSAFLTSPIKHPNPYSIGQGLGWLALAVLLLLGCIGLAAASCARYRTDYVRLLASWVAALSVLAVVLVQPFNSAPFVSDQRHDVGLSLVLLSAAMVALIVLVVRAALAPRSGRRG